MLTRFSNVSSFPTTEKIVFHYFSTFFCIEFLLKLIVDSLFPLRLMAYISYHMSKLVRFSTLMAISSQNNPNDVRSPSWKGLIEFSVFLCDETKSLLVRIFTRLSIKYHLSSSISLICFCYTTIQFGYSFDSFISVFLWVCGRRSLKLSSCINYSNENHSCMSYILLVLKRYI